MGILQMETTGRPDGTRVHDCNTMLEFLQDKHLAEPDYELDEDDASEVDREFMQFYHRRISWLRLAFYHRAVMDADHTLRLMDLTTEISPR